MSALSEIVGTASEPHSFTHNGKVYTARMIDDAMKVAWERRLLDRNREFWRESLTRAEYIAKLEQLNEKYMGGAYSMLSPFGLKMLNSTEGQLILACLIFDLTQLQVIGLMTERKADVTGLIKLIIRESLPVEDAPPDSPEAKEATAPNL